jgi:uncharacterized protein YkwD
MQKSVTQSSVCIPTQALIGFAIMAFMKNMTKQHHVLLWGLCVCGLLFGAISTSRAQDVTTDLLGRVNNLRASLGLSPYTLNGALSSAANAQARWMTDNNAVSHTQYDGSTPRDRAQAAGYGSQWVSENIYMGGIATVDNAWNFWINSAVHYAGLTNTHYNDIGIGTATGLGGQAFVLVFGNSTGAWQSASPSVATNNSGTGSAQNALPPLPIVGVDAVGNIMYEVQAGDNLGTIALLFGYTWDDIPSMLALNEMTEDDMRTLKVGSVFLVPPASGTYTPTPLPTQDPLIPTATATFTPEPATNTPIATFTATALPPAVYVRPSETATMPLLIRTLPPSTSVVMVSTPILKTDNVSQPTNTNQPPIWLWVALVVQVGVLGAALIEFFRRRR